MNRSVHKILTTHVGSLPSPQGLTEEAAVRQLVERQRNTGLDIINEGEHTKGGDWLSYTDDRFGGFTAGERKGPPIITLGKDRQEFEDFYKWASQRGSLFFELAIRSKRCGTTGFVPAPSLTPARRFCSARLIYLRTPRVPEASCS